MGMDRKTVLKVAKLARLRLTEDEVELFTGQLSRIIEYMDELRQCETEGVIPTTHVLPLQNRFRPDTPQTGLPLARLVELAPQFRDDCFVVPLVLPEEEEA